MVACDIKIIIKAPNQKIGDQTIDCFSDWTVKQLKERISIDYPLKPRVEDQRLIYSGHLLKNEQKLDDILETNDERLHTIHLVCSQKQDVSRSNISGSERNTTTNSGVAEATETSSFLNTNMSTFQWDTVSPEVLNNFTVSSPFISQEQLMQQMAAMQQLYVQCMAQYLNQTGYNLDTIHTANQSALNTSQSEASSSPLIHRQAEPAGVQPQRMDAGPAGAAVDDDDDAVNRDWLDWFYWISRSLVFVSILYFYSSLSRFVVVIGFGLLLYLYQNGFLNGNREEQRVRDAEERHDAQRVQEIMDGNIDGHRRANVATHRDNEERYSGLRLLWMTLSSLFTSLIPDQAAPVNLN
ncbi:homocysteine-responsive endoplasmic reticulum-resident ubiquitin-like domain member 2 protein isoform X2 [Leptotrombidium deliense]|uniref:Homocysteine-responsive endoplasmic reticulum-resident ubiquitin-like domain member 2 protein isoform X2 n=1 Tax=Leptotrombidium deliense TaxID=299467 RepID=A0A443SN13_9ACAR|nr:homocysteine-responsive endoplasmic reticulum-resident ubiquitin-like domain member 2 protein isoform X2 [Leptotrombidium deliense]